MRPFLQHPLVHSLAGMCLMGGWAAWSNSDFPMPTPLIAGLAQGGLTGVITFLMHRVISRVFTASTCWLCAAIAGMATSASFLICGHLIAATPAFWQTIALPFSVASAYALSFAYSLRKS
ncbi:hypothetical protein [Thalassobius sp. I31.1]|uniref:hypothetical protein n=1 Tax=Thalassobius sp. I31.1 TaxID=2109912 RepID=UPI000D1AD118|nr:hypothetical protein [Thalassobius sp. I31.1]